MNTHMSLSDDKDMEIFNFGSRHREEEMCEMSVSLPVHAICTVCAAPVRVRCTGLGLLENTTWKI